MYISKLVIDMKTMDSLKALEDAYEMHRFISRAFPNVNGSLGRVLYRIDGNQVIVVSELEPDWKNIFEGGHLESPAQSKEYDPFVPEGGIVDFRLFAGPSICSKSGRSFEERGKRRAILDEKGQVEWLERKLSGSARVSGISRLDQKVVRGKKRGHKYKINLPSVLYEGRLVVEDASEFCDLLKGNIGRGQMLGLGLLSVKR